MECLFNAGRLHLKRAAANLSPPTASELVGACLLSSPEWGKLLESYLSTRVARKRLDDIQAHICEAKVAAPGSEVNTRALAVVLAMLVEVESNLRDGEIVDELETCKALALSAWEEAKDTADDDMLTSLSQMIQNAKLVFPFESAFEECGASLGERSIALNIKLKTDAAGDAAAALLTKLSSEECLTNMVIALGPTSGTLLNMEPIDGDIEVNKFGFLRIELLRKVCADISAAACKQQLTVIDALLVAASPGPDDAKYHMVTRAARCAHDVAVIRQRVDALSGSDDGTLDALRSGNFDKLCEYEQARVQFIAAFEAVKVKNGGTCIDDLELHERLQKQVSPHNLRIAALLQRRYDLSKDALTKLSGEIGELMMSFPKGQEWNKGLQRTAPFETLVAHCQLKGGLLDMSPEKLVNGRLRVDEAICHT